MTAEKTEQWLDKVALYLLGAMLVVYGLGLVVPIMELDSAQYAHMSRQMLEDGHYLQVKEQNHDYLDKPPLLFWLSSLSYAVFGVAEWSFKLPTLLFGLLGLLGIYGLGRRLYGHTTGLLATVLAASTQGFVIMVLDVKTDGMLMGSVAFSCWQLLAYLQQRRTVNFVLAFVGIALGMLAKGPMGLMAPVLAFAPHLILQRRWRDIFRPEWISGLLIVFLILLPMLYGLYLQWGWEGPRFFIYTQSFGRITGDSKWVDDSSYFHFTHVWLWVAFPWGLAVYYELGRKLVALVRSRFRLSEDKEWITAGGFLLIFAGLSLSRYKLPHYLFVLIPFGSILAARALQHVAIQVRLRRWVLGLHIFLIVVLFTLVFAFLGYIFPTTRPAMWAVAVGGLGLCGWLLWHYRTRPLAQLLVPMVVAMAAGNYVSNGHFYPHLMDYQSSQAICQELKEHEVPYTRVVQFGMLSHSLDFYAGHFVTVINRGTGPDDDLWDLQQVHQERGRLWVVTNQKGYDFLQHKKVPIDRIYRFRHYNVQELSPDFLLPHSRPQTLSYRYLLVLPGPNDHLAIAR